MLPKGGLTAMLRFILCAALALILSPSRAEASDAANAGVRKTRVLLITARDCPRCEEELTRLQRAGGDFDKLRNSGWTIGTGPENHLQVIDREGPDESEAAELVGQLDVREFPTVACVSEGKIVRSYKTGCRTPLDVWTFGFLAKGVDERPKGFVLEAARAESTGHYPLRGNHWSVDEDWNPSRTKVIGHLRGPNHAHQAARYADIESWSYEELRSLHDNLHEQEMGGVSYATRSQPGNQFSATRKVAGR